MNRRNKSKVESLSEWLEIATGRLAQAGKQRIAQEIEVHFAEAVEVHLKHGEPEQVATAKVLAELGDPKAAGKRFRNKHLTEREAKRLDGAQKHAGSLKSLFLTYLGGLSCYHYVRGRESELSAESLKSFLLVAYFLSFLILPTISFIVMRADSIRRKVASIALVMFTISSLMGPTFALFFDSAIGIGLLLWGILDAYSWLRIWNKVHKAGDEKNGAPRPA